MAFDETYNEPENVEVLVKSLNPDQPAELYYAHAGDAGADLRTTEEVTLKPFQRGAGAYGSGDSASSGLCGLGTSTVRSCRQTGRYRVERTWNH